MTNLVVPGRDWGNRPVVETPWLVDGWLPASPQVSMLYGAGGLGKSMLALQLAVAMATGERWIGQRTKQGKSLLLMCEDDADNIHKRLCSILDGYGKSFIHLGDRLVINSRPGLSNELAVLKYQKLEPTERFREMREEISGAGFNLIVLDSLYNVYGGNENDRTQVHTFMNGVRHLAIAANCPLLILAHPSRAGIASGSGEGGSTAWRNAARTMLYLRKPSEEESANPSLRVLEIQKQNYAPSDGRLWLGWEDGHYKQWLPDIAGVSRVHRPQLSVVDGDVPF